MIGIKFDASLMNNQRSTVYDGPNLNYSAQPKVFGTALGKLGFDLGAFMPYVTGGVAALRSTASMNCPAGAPFGVCAFTGPFTAYETKTNTGWALGGGIEVAMTPQWSLYLDYLHADFGTQTSTFTTPLGVVSGDTRLTFDKAVAGINLRF